MATTRRDIELLISAKETTGRSFGEVTRNITELNAKIAEQVAAAAKGEGSLKELRDAQTALAQAARDLSGIQGQIDAYNKLVASTDKQEAAYEKAKKKLTEYQAKLAETEKVTAKQAETLQRYENAVRSTGDAVEKNKNDIAAQAAVLERAGVSTRNLAETQTQLVNSARNVGAGLTQTRAGIENFSESVRLAAERQKTADREAAASTATRVAAEKAAAEQGAAALKAAADARAAAIKQMAQAEAELASQRGFYKKIEEARQLGDASRFVQLFAEAVKQVNAADAQSSALGGFRAIGQQAATAANDLSRFVTVGQTFATSSSAVAAGLRAIIQPGGEALKTLEGVEKAIHAADAAAAAAPKNTAILNVAYNNLAEASAALVRKGGLVDAFRNQETALAAARTQFEAAQADVRGLGLAMASATTPTEKMIADLRAAEAVLDTTGRAVNAEETRLGALSRELRAAGINTHELAAEQARLEAAATTAGATLSRLDSILGRNGARANGILGLRPQDLTQVGYQLNDIFVSLASGQAPLTVFIQQGAQLSQIPGFISAIGTALLRFFPLIAILSAAAAVIVELVGDFNRLVQASRDLKAAPFGDTIDAKALAAAEERLDLLGASADGARKALLALLEEGFDLDALTKYSTAALQLSERLGIDLAQATTLLLSIQKGGIDAVYELALKTNDLTTAELDQAEALFAAGRAAEARELILNRVAAREKEIAEATQSRWTPAIRGLQTAWQNLTNWIADYYEPLVKRVLAAGKAMISTFTLLTGLLSGKSFDEAFSDANKVLVPTNNRQVSGPRGESDQQIRDRAYKKQLDLEYNVQKKLTNEQRLQLAAKQAGDKADKAGVSSAVRRLAVEKATAAEQSKINDEGERASKRSAAAAKREAKAAETAQNKREAAQLQLDRGMRQLNRNVFAGESASLEERLQGVDEKYESLYDSIKKVRDLGATKASDGTDLKTIEFQIEAQKARLKNEETISFYQQQAALLDKQRAAEVEKISDAQARGAISAKDAVAGAAEINARLSPQIVESAQKALDIAKTLAGASPSPEMVSWIASLERIISGEGTNTIVAKVGLDSLDANEKKLNDLLKQRDDLVAAYTALGELGIDTSTDVRNAMAVAFKDASKDIGPVTDELLKTIETLHTTKDLLTGQPLITDTAYNAWLAKIAAVQAGLQQTKTYLSPLENQTLQGIASAGTAAFTTLGTSMAGFIAGTKSLGDVFADVGKSIIQSLAQITMAIANAIIQFLILRALESAAGLPPGTLTGGGKPGGGLFGLFHDGGVVNGKSGKVRSDNPANWIGAPKFHGGGMAGLAPDEYRTILKRGEEVLTEDNPRHVGNAGSGSGVAGSATPALKQVLLVDPEMVPNALQTRSGQKAFLTVIRANKETIKQVLK